MKIIKTTEIYTDPWLSLFHRHYITSKGQPGTWTFSARPGKNQAVIIIPYVHSLDSFLIIKQYRYPLMQWIYEFPAGIIEENEKPEHTALRELTEETGYTGHITHTLSHIGAAVGISSETLELVYVQIENMPLSQQLDVAEHIISELLPRNKINQFITQCQKEHTIIDAKLMMFLQGLSYTKTLPPHAKYST